MPSRPRRRVAWLLLPIALLFGLDRAADALATRLVLSDLRTSARAEAELRVALLRSEISKQRSLPLVLAGDPDLRLALQTRSEVRLATLSSKLEGLAAGTGAGVIYALDAAGLTLAASNWREPDSFVGSDYAFRPYRQGAMADGTAEHFALGTVSRQPGLYLARRVEGLDAPLGVVVVKTLFDAVEAGWRQFRAPVLVTDEAGIVLVTSEPAWRFQALTPLSSEQRQRIRDGLQFGDAPLTLLPLPQGERGTLRLPRDGGTEPVLVTRVAVPGMPWTLHLVTPTRVPVELAATAARAVALLAGLLLLGAGWAALQRRRRLRRDMDRQRQQRQRLEAQVQSRTAELEQLNTRLVAQAAERQRAEADIHRLRDDLVRANRLALLGQITASVAHEINQPVAAIRSFADNAQIFLERGEPAQAGRGLATIAGLTERIGTITGGLRNFARRATASTGPVPVRAAVDGALLLLGHRLREEAVAVEVLVPRGLAVRAERVRLEQVLVNLIQNAVEALSGRRGGRIRVEAALAEPGPDGEGAANPVSLNGAPAEIAAGPAPGAIAPEATPGAMPRTVRIVVSDNGPGLAPEVSRALFMPFTTTKPEGLGLGLVISRDIIRDFGGTLEAPIFASAQPSPADLTAGGTPGTVPGTAPDVPPDLPPGATPEAVTTVSRDAAPDATPAVAPRDAAATARLDGGVFVITLESAS